eukprot:scaffold6346_cov116-Skeletonema_marinoi.AAC.1
MRLFDALSRVVDRQPPSESLLATFGLENSMRSGGVIMVHFYVSENNNVLDINTAWLVWSEDNATSINLFLSGGGMVDDRRLAGGSSSKHEVMFAWSSTSS